MDIEALQAALKDREAGWSAAPTRLSLLPPEIRRRLLGVPEISVASALQQASGTLGPAYPSTKVPPAAIDWRANGANWVSPIRDQDLCRSCAAFALCAVMESSLRIAENDSGLKIDLAPGPLFFSGHPQGCACGRFASELIEIARTQGVGIEQENQYSIDKPIGGSVHPFVRISSARHIVGDARVRKLAIAEGGPVYAEMRVFGDFFAYTGGVYRHLTEGDEGLHAVAIVGYDDRESCWIGKNSWGPDMQDNGFFRIAYGECEIDSRPFIAVEVERVDREGS